MAVEVERLLVSLEARITQFERNMDRAVAKSRASTARIEADTNRMADKVQAAFAKAGMAAGSAFKAGIAGVAAGAIGAISIEGVTKSIADLAKLQDVADRTGVSTKQIQEFGYAVEQSGGEIEDVQNGLQKFAVNLSKAGQGSGDLAKLLEANNVALRDKAGALRPVGELLGEVADLIANAASEEDKLNIATMAFGRGAAQGLVLALSGGRKGLADFARQANDAGVVMENGLIKKAADLDDELTKLASQMKVLGDTLAVEFAGDALKAGLQGVLDTLREMRFTIDAIRKGNLSDALPFFENSPAGRAALAGRNIRGGFGVSRLTDGEIAKFYDRTGAAPQETQGDHPSVTVNRPTVVPSEGGGDALLGDAIKAYVERVVKAESGGRSDAKNPNSSAAGVGQFINSTFVDQFRKTYASEYSRILGEAGGDKAAAARVVLQYRSNAEISKNLIESYAKENAKALQDAGQAVTEANLHLAHFLGAGGAIAALRANPNALARDVLGDKAANANPTIIGNGHTIADVLAYADRRANATRIAAGDLTPAEEKVRDQKKSYDDALRESAERTAALGREAEALNQNAYAKAFAAEKARLLADIEKDGATASPEQVAAIDSASAAYARRAEALDNAEKASKSLKKALEEVGEIGADATKTFVSELRAGASAADALKAALDRVVDRLLDNMIDSLFKNLFSAGSGGGLLGGLLNFGGPKAAGGPVAGDRTYLVGEKGPELFAPGRSGAIIPNSAMARVRAPAVPVARAATTRISPEVRMRIDLTGANGDAAIERIARRAAAEAGQQAYAAAAGDARRNWPAQRHYVERHKD